MRLRSTPARAAGGALVILAIHAGVVAAEPPEITVENDRVTASIREAPLEDVIAAFAQASGALVRGGVQTPRNVTLELQEVPMQQALERLLGDQNFALVYRTDGSVKVLRLLGASSESPVPISTPAGVAAAPQSPAGLLARSVSIPESGRLSGMVGGSTATLQQLLDIAVNNDDLSVRVEALAAGVSAVEADPELKEAATSALDRMTDDTLESLIRGVAGDRARELVAQVGARSRVSSVRSRAYQLLRRLVPQAGAGAPGVPDGG